MALTSDTFIERSQLKRQVAFWRLAAVGVMVFFLVVLVERNAQLPQVVKKDEYIARVTLSGIIGDNRKLYDLLDNIHADDNAKALLLNLNTPGGVAVGGETIYRKIEQISSKKPVVVSMRAVCASAGYMISLAGDHVLAMPGTITGSIGVIFQAAEVSELVDKLGINPITVKSGRFKGSPSITEPFGEQEKDVIQQMIDEFHQVFVTMVSEARDIPIDKVRKIADGRVYSAIRAKELGLIDALGGEEEAIAWLAENRDIDPKLEIRDKAIKSNLDKIMEHLGHKTGLDVLTQTGIGAETGLMLLWKPQLLD